MASYLSYFTSNSSAAPPQQQYQQTQPATSTWTSTVSSRLASLRKALTRDSEDDDPDYEDCSHVSNVLRAYYTQKGQPLPEWLPPDPRKPVAQAPSQQYGQYGGAYNNPYSAPAHVRGNSGGRAAGGGGLSDLWDSGPATNAPPTQPQSLRTPRPTPQSLRSYDNQSQPASLDPYTAQNATTSPRPLPSQRSGSYQNTPAAGTASRTDRLRARLQGGGSGRNSPAPQQQSSESYNEPDQYSNQQYSSAGVNSRGFGGPAPRPRPGGPR